MAELIDLHLHTTSSDGTLTPGELVSLAKKSGLKGIAITDHDTVEGIEEGISKGIEEGIEVIPGVELSTEFEREMHILGLLIDYKSNQLLDHLRVIRSHRDFRNPRIIEKLNQLGFDITNEEVQEYAGGKVVGRAHIASIMLQKGYIKDLHEAFEKYLGFGKAAYVRKDKLTPKEAIGLIRAANGIPVIAHPGHFKKPPQEIEQMIIELKELGLLGIEVYHSDHNAETTKMLLGIAKRNNLLVTGGSDFHGENKHDIRIGTGTGNLRIDYSILDNLKNYQKSLQ